MSKKLFWIGVVAIVVAVVCMAGSGGLFLATRSQVEKNQEVAAAGFIQKTTLTNDPLNVSWDSTANLSMNLDDFNADEILVRGPLTANTIAVTDTLTTTAGVDINGSLEVTGTVDLRGVVSSSGNDFRLNDNALISGTVTASGAADLNSTLAVAGVATFESEAHADNGLRITGNITQVSGSALLNSLGVTSTLTANTVQATDNITTSADFNGSDLWLSGNVYAATATQALTYGTGTFTGTLSANTVQATNAMTVGAGLGVTGQSNLDNGLRVTGNITQVSGSALLNSLGVTSTLTANTVQATDNITTSADFSGSDLWLSGNVYAATATQALVYGTGTFTSTLSANTVQATNAVTVGADLGVTGQANLDNGLRITGNVTQVSGSALLNSLGVTSTLSANTLEAADNITATGHIHADSLWLGGNIYATDAAQALTYGTGTFTGTLSANTLSATDNITTSKALTATTYLGFGAPYAAVSSTVDYTSTQTIVLGAAPKAILPVTAGGPGAELDGTTSISDGAYVGQMLIIVNVDTTAGHTVVVKNSANTALQKDRTLDIDDAMGLYWDGSNWRLLWITDASA